MGAAYESQMSSVNHSCVLGVGFHVSLCGAAQETLRITWSVTPKLQWSFPLSSQAAENIAAASFNGRHNTFVYGGMIFERKF